MSIFHDKHEDMSALWPVHRAMCGLMSSPRRLYVETQVFVRPPVKMAAVLLRPKHGSRFLPNNTWLISLTSSHWLNETINFLGSQLHARIRLILKERTGHGSKIHRDEERPQLCVSTEGSLLGDK